MPHLSSQKGTALSTSSIWTSCIQNSETKYLVSLANQFGEMCHGNPQQQESRDFLFEFIVKPQREVQESHGRLLSWEWWCSQNQRSITELTQDKKQAQRPLNGKEGEPYHYLLPVTSVGFIITHPLWLAPKHLLDSSSPATRPFPIFLVLFVYLFLGLASSQRTLFSPGSHFTCHHLPR